jgi:aminomethyltransferase
MPAYAGIHDFVETATRPEIRYIRGGTRETIFLHTGDRLKIRDEEGGQPCEVDGTQVLDTTHEPGSEVSLFAEFEGPRTIFAAGAPMMPDEQSTPTDLRVEIFRGNAAPHAPPPPLAQPKLDILVPAAEARSYTVQAGDYIQIVDIDGQQCSDFLAFDEADLKNGIEYGLDSTTTRTLNHSVYPGPGLFAKFFDERMQAMVEVVRDTCGRHDTFGLACTAKGYADMGYPGHPSCTENFNAVLAEHKVKPRKGWPAINFFYNTEVDTTGAIVADEAWSRPGDYVLLRALKNLVCATSSCADDVGTTNAYNPTDIQVRIYDKTETFSKGIVHRMTADAEARLTRESGFFPRTSQLTRNFVENSGFWLPECYTGAGPVEEYTACRERAALIDLSSLRKFEITGPDAENLLALAMTRNIRKLSIGQVVYTAMCYEHGGMIDDGTVMRLGANNFRFVSGADYAGVWLRELASARGFKVFVRSSTDQLNNVSLQGPLSRDILAPLIFTPPLQPTIAELKWFRFTIGRLGGPEGIPLVISRTGYTGELGYEIWCHPTHAAEVWDALMAGGNVQPMGLAALDMLRIEAGLILAGREFSDQTDPYEAGIGFAVTLREEEFIGKQALERRNKSPRDKLVGLVIENGEPVQHGDCVHIGRAQIGVVTSAVRSPVLGKSIALARVDAHHAAIGTAVEIGKLDGQQKRLRAEVTAFPHYDPEKKRVRT